MSVSPAAAASPSVWRGAAGSTPRLYRLWSIGLLAVLSVTALTAFVAAATLRAAGSRMTDNTGPVLVSVQQLSSSLAEADAAATAAFLSGKVEDREQRRLYEQALARANQQVEQIAALVGDDPEAHRRLQSIAVQVPRYAGLIEAARASVANDAAGGDRYLVQALDLLASGVSGDLAELTSLSQKRLRNDERAGAGHVVAVIVLGAIALTALVAVQVGVTRRSRRLLNPGLVVATVALLSGVLWLLSATAGARNDVERARDEGYESIALTAQIQTTAYRSKADESVALITGDAARRTQAQERADRLLSAPVDDVLLDTVRFGRPSDSTSLLLVAAGEADSPRERAAVAEMLVRWQRWRDTVAEHRGDPSPGGARAIATGRASSTFNGFNFSVESVLSDNREQFLAGLNDASGRLRWLSLVALVAPLVAAAGALGGLQQRIEEYR